MPIGLRRDDPAKITSCARVARTDDAFCSPRHHVSASNRFDLPDPFGPTIAVTPDANSISVLSAKVLKPCSVMRLSRIKS